MRNEMGYKMRQIMCIVLCIGLCFALCSCGKEPEIAGTWEMWFSNTTAEFYDDGTGVLYYDGREIDLEWSYNSENDTYKILVKSNMKSYESEISTYKGVEERISFAGGEFYRFVD